MFVCEKYKISMLASKADETCAKRYSVSLADKNRIHDFEKCRTCKRGAIQYELGKHINAVSRGIAETTEKGNEMAKEIHKTCTKHGAFTTTGPAGKCPECKAEDGSEPPRQKKAVKKISTDKRLSITRGGGGAHYNNIDNTRFPRLHSRLMGLAMEQILQELESKA